MTYDRDLDEQLSLLFCAAVERDEVAEYLLGLKPTCATAETSKCFTGSMR